MNVTLAIVMARGWWTFILRGVVAILFGLVCLFVPPIAILGLATLFGFWLIVDGIAGVTGAWGARAHRTWWVSLLEGIAGLLAGILSILWPVITALVLTLLVGAWAIVTGATEVWMAIRLREHIRGELFMIIAGLISIGFGLYVIIFPGAGILSVLWLIAVFAIAFGLSFIGLGWRLRGVFEQARRQNEYVERGMRP
ncbi:MAG TPA: HdeD family acid-resistance protein [Candidatus Limnocylindria bacterium]|nr:HdeD family acid-resistance protein [Candidatus Limnocylindria bacterium]